MFIFLLTLLIIILASLRLVIIRKIWELLVGCSLFDPKEFIICFLGGDKFAKYLSDLTNSKYPTDPFCKNGTTIFVTCFRQTGTVDIISASLFAVCSVCCWSQLVATSLSFNHFLRDT